MNHSPARPTQEMKSSSMVTSSESRYTFDDTRYESNPKKFRTHTNRNHTPNDMYPGSEV